jgi:surface protein
MSAMFANNKRFDQNLNDWDVRHVVNMAKMFDCATSFNKPLNKWKVANVANMSGMFHNARCFNQSIGDWDVRNVVDMTSMFDSAVAFNQPLSRWNVSRVTDMAKMFQNTDIFNQPLDDWDVSNVINMSYMFAHSNSFNQPLGRWNVVNVTDMSGMFQCASQFNQSLEDWNVVNLRNVHKMFFMASKFNSLLERWNVVSGRVLFPLPLPNRLTTAIREVTDIRSAQRYCNLSWGIAIFDEVQINHQVAELWMQFLVHLSAYVGGEDIVKCFIGGHSGSMTYCIILTAYLHPSTEGLVFQFFKNILCDTRGQILERQEIRTLAREIYNDIQKRSDRLDGLCSTGCCSDLKNGPISDLVLGFGFLAISPKFRENMQRSPQATIAKLRTYRLTRSSAAHFINSLPDVKL